MIRQKFIPLIVILQMLTLQVPSVFASYIQVMSDEELDTVHAGGLNFNFDSFLGSRGTTESSTGSVVSVSSVDQGPLAYNPNSNNVQMLTPNTPQTPISPIAPVSPINPVDAQSPVDPAGVIALFSDPSDPTASAVPSTASVAATPSQASTPATPSSPVAPTPPIVVDVIASSGGDFKVAMQSNNGLIPVPFAASGGGFNSLNVSDTAQQNLSAMVNVNAAGSIVPVQINLTVLMNSSVENLNASNSLNLSSATTYQIPQ